MKKMDIRKITAMAAALVMCISMSACGDTSSGASDKPASAKKEASAKSDTLDLEITNGDEAEKSEAAPETADDAFAGETLAAAAEHGGEGEALDGAADATIKSDAKKAATADEGIHTDAEAIAETTREAADDTEDYTEISPEDIPPEPEGEAFVLTAGEWNDNDNWGFFTNLAKNGTINFPVFGFDPTHRIAVTVTKDGEPARDQTVELIDSEGNLIWTARSDKNGMAYVFYKADQKPAKVVCGESSQDVQGDSSDEQGTAGTTETTLETTADSKKAEDTQVMFILDTTGSMGDEIAYLQMDFASIAKEVDDGHTTFSANFYRDNDDDYVTKCNPFTDDVKTVQSAINKESAAGGGDFPEAIADVLDETITKNDSWSDNANKIAFLIFDAPPHDGREEQLEEAVKTAAAKGIHLVPVVSSGADRETELFGRAIAAETNSNYVFLTDDSGIGDSHLEPIIGDYEVELLHDIIVRNITELRD